MANKIVQNSAKLLSANAIAQAIGLVIYPLLTRLYSPEDFGELSVFLSTAGIITLLSTAEFQYAIVLPKDDKKAWNILRCGLLVLVIVSICCLWRPLLAFYVLEMGLWTLLSYWYTRKEQFHHISYYQIVQSTGSAGIKTGLAFTPIPHGLIWGSFIAPLISLISNWLYAGRKSTNAVRHTPWRMEELIATAKEYRKFPCFNLPRSLIGSLGTNLPAIILAPAFGLSALGGYSMAIAVSFCPINIITSSINRVLFQQFADKSNKKEPIKPLFYSYLKGASIIVCLLTILALLDILPSLCELLFGAEWRITGEYIRWMMPWIAMTLFVGPICSLCEVFGEQKTGLILEILLFVCSSGGMCIGLFTHSLLHAIIGYSFGSFIAISIQLVWYIRLVKKYERNRQTTL